MAVKREKIKERLRILFPKANLSQKRLDEISERLAKKPADDADDNAVDEVINDFNAILSFEAIAKDDDRIRTLESKSKEQPPKQEPTPPANPEPPKNDIPDWAKAMVDSNQKLLQEIEALKNGKITESKQQIAQKLFNESGILKGLKPEVKEKWISRISVNTESSEEDIKSQITDLENEFNEITQAIADSGSYSSQVPAISKPGNSSNKQLIEDVVKSM